MFELRIDPRDTVAAWEAECEETCSNGHLVDCEALEPAEDLGDLWDKTCSGCCPHGNVPAGLTAWQSATAQQFVGFVERFRSDE